MANTTIQIKRSFANSSPASLKEGELAYSFASNTLFIGNQSNSAVGIISPNLALQSLDTRYIDFIKLPYFQYPGYVEGRMWYNQNAHSIQFQTDFDTFDAVPGQIEYVRVYNNTGVQIDKGKAVYVIGVKGSDDPVDSRILSIALADATDGNKKDVLGLVGHNIPNGSEGFVITRGPMYGINTSNLVPNDRFHLAPSPGNLSGYAPEYPNWPMDLGQCLTQDAVYGSVYVDIVDHSFERVRVLYDAYVGGNFVVEGDLTVFGTQNFVSASDFYVGGQFLYLDGADAINVDSTIFTGSGLNDMTFKGIYEGDAASTDFYVRIASAGVQGISVDKFDWSYNSSFSPLQGSNISITGSNQSLANGISVKFVSILGHTVGDQWSGTAYATNRDFGIIGHYNDGTYKHAGLFRDSVDGDFKFFTRYVPEPAGDINASGATFQLGNVRVDKITANSFYKGGIDLYSAINSAANTTAIYANNTLRLANAGINFVNTSTIRATVSTGSGIANISFDLIGSTGGIASFPVASGSSTVSANGLNFVNSATVGVTVSQGTSGNADISFTTLAGGGSVTSVDTGLGLTGGPITTAGTISANIASTTVQGVTKLIDVVNSNDSANAATANSVKVAFDQATLAYAQANTGTTVAQAAYGQANLAYTQANTGTTIAQAAYGQANLAYTQANTGTTIAQAAYGQANAAYTQANTANSIAISAYGQANAAYAQANAAYTQANSANTTAISAYGQANAAYTQANTANATASSAYGQANNAYSAANSAANTVRVSANSGSVQSAVGLNFINTSSVIVSVGAGTGSNANVGLSAVSGSTTVAGIVQLNDTVTSTSTTLAATANSVNVAYNQATSAYNQANNAYTQANTANTTGSAAYTQANAAYSAANTSGNTVRVSANSGSTLSNKQLNFVNTATVTVTITDPGTGNANIAFTSTATGTGTLNNFPVSVNTGSTVTANGLNFVNSSTVTVTVSQGINGNANVLFTSISGGSGTVTSVDTGIGLTGGPIISSGTISANIATTSVQGVTKLIDSVTSTDTANAATGAAVKTAYDQATNAYNSANNANSVAVSAYGQANLAYTQANTGTTTAQSAYNQANLAYTQANTGTTVAQSAYGQANLAYTQANTGTNTAIAAYGQANLAYTRANTGTNTAIAAYGQANLAYTQANTGTTVAQAAYGQANLAYTQANTGTSTAQAAYAQANLAYSQANTGTITAQSAYGQANLAYTQANTGTTVAQAAYAQANSSFTTANNSANTVQVSANSGTALSNVSLNFVNTATVQVSVTSGGTGIANVSFTSTGGTGTPGGSNTEIQFNNNGSFGGSNKFTYNTAPNLVSVDADLKLANTNKLYFGGEQANNSVANSKFSISFNVSATSLDFTFLG